MSDLRTDLEARLAGEVRFDAVSRALYSTDASVYQIQPLGAAVVRSREDVLAALECARAHGCSVTARGGGTSQAGQAIGAGLQIDTSKYFNRVLEVNVEERWARVEPGIVLDELNAQLAPHRLRFAPDISTASRATIGGMISNNSSGARSVRYGKTIDHVLDLHVALADGSVAHLRPLTPEELEAACAADTFEGACYRAVRETAARHVEEIERRYPKILRRVGGYNLDAFTPASSGQAAAPFNLAKLIVGSEGTLGFILEARLNLVPLPKAKAVLTIEYDDLLDALGETPAILAHDPSAVEVMDRSILDHARENPVLDAMRRAVLGTDCGALLCVELYGDSAQEIRPRLNRLESNIRARGVARHTACAVAPADQARIWKLRESSLGLSMAMKGDAKSISFVEDTAVAPEKLRDFIERFLEVIRRHGTTAGVYAHASVGCLHVRPVVNLKTAAGVQQFEAIANEIADLVLEFGGALSGEHGDGLVRGPFMERMFGPDLYESFRTIKRTFDPDGLFNPGKIVDAPPLTANLRYGPEYRTPDPAAVFDHGEHGGLGRAVEMCSGVGACRKTLSGTMCPSYMATRDEAHSTRGRANTLRLAMNGALGNGSGPRDAGLGDREVYDVLDLCLECRACKTECPVGVDMARFKSEFLADYWRRTRHAAAGARPRAHPHAVGARQSRGAADQPVAGTGVGTGAQREALRHRPAPVAAPLGAAHAGPGLAETRRNPRAVRSPGRGPVQRHVHQLLRSADRTRGGGRAGGGRALGRPGAARLLRPAPHLAGPARRRARPGGERRAPAAPAGRGRNPYRAAGAELPLRAQGRRTGSAARRGAATGARGGRRVRALRGLRERAPRGWGRHAAATVRAGRDPAPRPLPPEVPRPGRPCAGAPRAHSGDARHGSRLRMLRHGRLVRLRARALRHLAADRGTPAAARRAGARSQQRPGGRRHLVPPPGARLRRRPGATPRRAAAISAGRRPLSHP